MIEIAGQILLIALQNAVYLSCLAWVAWRGERLTGKDSFHLIIFYALGAWLLASWSEAAAVPQFLILPTIAFLCFLLNELSQRFINSGDENAALVRVITLSSIALVAFDWLTSHTPLSIAFDPTIKVSVITCGLAVWAIVTVARRAKWLLALRLGTQNSWAMEYWRGDSIKDTYSLPKQLPLLLLSALCWLPILFVPLATTGLLGGTILKDVAIAILIARVAAARQPVIILAVCLTLSLLRAGTAFAIPNSASSPLVEATIFITLLGWIRYRGSRTAWEESHAR